MTDFENQVLGPAKDQLHDLQQRLWKDWRGRNAAGGSTAPEVAPAAAAQQPLNSQTASPAAADPMPAPTGRRIAAAAAADAAGGTTPHSAQQLPAPQHMVPQLHPPATLAAGQETLQLQARLHKQQQQQLAAALQEVERLQAQLGEAQRQLAAEQQGARGLRDQLASAQQQATQQQLAAAQKQEQLTAEQQRTQDLSAQLAAEQQQTGNLQEQLTTTQRAVVTAWANARKHELMWHTWRRLRLNELPELIGLRQRVREL